MEQEQELGADATLFPGNDSISSSMSSNSSILYVCVSCIRVGLTERGFCPGSVPLSILCTTFPDDEDDFESGERRVRKERERQVVAKSASLLLAVK